MWNDPAGSHMQAAIPQNQRRRALAGWELPQTVPIAEVIGRTVELQRRGNHLYGKCPACAPSEGLLAVREDLRVFRCYDCCTGGGVIAWLKLTDGMSQQQALARLIVEYGD